MMNVSGRSCWQTAERLRQVISGVTDVGLVSSAIPRRDIWWRARADVTTWRRRSPMDGRLQAARMEVKANPEKNDKDYNAG
jgi:hypothetical protein